MPLAKGFDIKKKAIGAVLAVWWAISRLISCIFIEFDCLTA